MRLRRRCQFHPGKTSFSQIRFFAATQAVNIEKMTAAAPPPSRNRGLALITVQHRSADDDDRKKEDLEFMAASARRKSSGLSRSDPSFDKVVSERAQKQQNWKNKLRHPFDIIQTQIVKDKAKNIQQQMKRLQAISGELALVESESSAEIEKENDFTSLVLAIKEEIQGLHTFTDFLLHDRLNAKEMLALRDLRRTAKHNPAQDISVRYFGLDWREMDDVVAEMNVNVCSLCDAVLQSADGQRPNTLLPTLLARDLKKIGENLVAHAEAVLNGRLNKGRNDMMREQQNRHRDFLDGLRRSSRQHNKPEWKLGSRMRRMLPSLFSSLKGSDQRSVSSTRSECNLTGASNNRREMQRQNSCNK